MSFLSKTEPFLMQMDVSHIQILPDVAEKKFSSTLWLASSETEKPEQMRILMFCLYAVELMLLTRVMIVYTFFQLGNRLHVKLERRLTEE